MKYVPTQVRRGLRLVGERFTIQRKLLNLTVEDLAQRAGVSPTTVRNLEHGQSVRTDSLFAIAGVLQLADSLVESSDPYRTDIGQLRAAEQLPKRVRR
jgi:transcriptional regulator with XRE-family HTH domain